MNKIYTPLIFVSLLLQLSSLNSCKSEAKASKFKNLCQIAKAFNWKGEKFERLSAFSHQVSFDIKSSAIKDSVAALASFHESKKGERYNMLVKGLKASKIEVTDCPALKNNF